MQSLGAQLTPRDSGAHRQALYATRGLSERQRFEPPRVSTFSRRGILRQPVANTQRSTGRIGSGRHVVASVKSAPDEKNATAEKERGLNLTIGTSLGQDFERDEDNVNPLEGQDDEGDDTGGTAVKGSAALGVLLVSALAGIAAFGYFFKDDINHAIDFFSAYIEDAGPLGYLVFTLGYAALEVLAIPAIPLTMSAGLLFGSTLGTVLCSLSGTIAATVAFLIARYVARDRILALVRGNKKFLAVDRAVGEDSFRVVTLLRLSPLLPFSLGNYVYGLTSVKLVPYVLGSWIGMLPGTWAYVSAGAFGRTLLEADEGGVAFSDSSLWTLAAGLAVTVAAAAYVTNIAKNAIKDLD